MKTIYLDSTTLRGKEGWVWPCSVYGESTVQTRYLQSPGFHFYSFDLSGISCPFKTCIHPCRYIYTYRYRYVHIHHAYEYTHKQTTAYRHIQLMYIDIYTQLHMHTIAQSNVHVQAYIYTYKWSIAQL